VNTERFKGFADLYDSVRPQTPQKVVEIVSHLLGSEALGSVVDLGSGTGLSTRIWTGKAEKVVGIEPTTDMLDQARLANPDIRFLNANSYDTTLETNSVQVVVCSQSFHWMEPTAALKEIGRILKSGGVFATSDCQWPVCWDWRSEAAYRQLMEKAHRVRSEVSPPMQYPKERHLGNMRASEVFSYCGTVLFDNVEDCDDARFVGIALSQGHIQDILKTGSETLNREIEELKRTASSSSKRSMRVSYVLNYGIRTER